MTPTKKNAMTIGIMEKLRKQGMPESHIESMNEDELMAAAEKADTDYENEEEIIDALPRKPRRKVVMDMQ